MTAGKSGGGRQHGGHGPAPRPTPVPWPGFWAPCLPRPVWRQSPPAQSSRFVVDRCGGSARSKGGAALIAVDGKPPKPYRVGARIEDGLVLQGVAPSKRHAGPCG
jgi:hypothetical protein